MMISGTFPPIHDAWFLTGPTASGKSRVGIELAERIGAEIISLDSMAVYRGMDIGTAKPTAAERSRVVHHLLDVVDPNTDFSLSEYVRAAHQVIAELRSRNRPAVFVGGTPLYLKALLRGLYPGPPADWEFRRQIEDELALHGLEALHKRLELVDPYPQLDCTRTTNDESSGRWKFFGRLANRSAINRPSLKMEHRRSGAACSSCLGRERTCMNASMRESTACSPRD